MGTSRVVALLVLAFNPNMTAGKHVSVSPLLVLHSLPFAVSLLIENIGGMAGSRTLC